MKNENGHIHAISYYEKTSIKHFIALLVSVLYTRLRRGKSLTVHFPLEIMYPTVFPDKKMAHAFIWWGEWLKKRLHIPLYWENAPLLSYGSWRLKYGQMDWSIVPSHVDLCLDTGHLMLGSQSVNDARKRIKSIVKQYGKKIKHLHIHENNLISDTHNPPSQIITKQLLKEMCVGRTYIFEK